MIPITHPFTCQHITSSALISRKDITVLINPCFRKCKAVMESLLYRLPFLLTQSYGPSMDQRPKHTILYLDQGILLFTSGTAMKPYINSSCNHAKFRKKKKKQTKNFQTQAFVWPIYFKSNKQKSQNWKSRKSPKTKIQRLEFAPVSVQTKSWELGASADHNSILNLLRDKWQSYQGLFQDLYIFPANPSPNYCLPGKVS